MRVNDETRDVVSTRLSDILPGSVIRWYGQFRLVLDHTGTNARVASFADGQVDLIPGHLAFEVYDAEVTIRSKV
jgi:hypothetical protein